MEPIVFLKQFNRLADQYNPTYKKKGPLDFKLQPFSKFPIPQYYQRMESIRTGTIEKQLEDIDKAKQRFNKQEELFLTKHRNFLRKTLNNMIQDNEDHLKTMQRSKTFYMLKQARKNGADSRISLQKYNTGQAEGEFTHRTRSPSTAIDNSKSARYHSTNNPKGEVKELDYQIMNADALRNATPILFNKPKTAQITMRQSNFKFKSGTAVSQMLKQRKTITYEDYTPHNNNNNQPEPSGLVVEQRAVIPSRNDSRRDTIYSSKIISSKTTRNIGERPSVINLQLRSQNLHSLREIPEDSRKLSSLPTGGLQSQAVTREMVVADSFFDPNKYASTRFAEPLIKLTNDHDKALMDKSEQFKRMLAYHFVNDQKFQRV